MPVSDKVKAMLATSSVASISSMDIGSKVPRISLKSSKFTTSEGAKLGDEIHVVILGVEPKLGLAHTFFEGKYVPGSTAAPTCSSTDGVTPDPQSTKIQNETCVNCKQAQWGSAKSMSGGKAKACKDSKRIYVVLAEELDNPDRVVYLINITVLSLKPLAEYGKKLNSEGIPTPVIVITKLSFDEESSVPRLAFHNEGFLNDDSVEEAIELAEKEEWKSIAPLTKLAAPEATAAIEHSTPEHIESVVTAIEDAASAWDT